MIVISTPEPDTYGQYARASLLADYAELLALNGQPVGRATIADFLADNGWNLDLVHPGEDDAPLLEEPEAPPEQLDDADEAASIVFRQLDERRHVLAGGYPFELTDDMISVRQEIDREANVYIAILALTIAHAFRVASRPRPETLFEQTVTGVLRTRGLSAVGFAAARRHAGSFEEALQVACEEVGLKAAPDAAPRLARAHDEGVDVLCHIGWENDLRPGTWGFIGQVTVAKSDSWGAKITEPKPRPWARRVGTWILPLPFLAVPHHVEHPMMRKLTIDGQAVVLDRLRLVRFKEENDNEEREVIQAVLREDIEPFTG